MVDGLEIGSDGLLRRSPRGQGNLAGSGTNFKSGRRISGIGLVEVVWKVVAVVLNCCFTNSTTYHDSLHGFWVGRSIGTANLKVKLLQQVKAIREEVFHTIFLDLHKA